MINYKVIFLYTMNYETHIKTYNGHCCPYKHFLIEILTILVNYDLIFTAVQKIANLFDFIKNKLFQPTYV